MMQLQVKKLLNLNHKALKDLGVFFLQEELFLRLIKESSIVAGPKNYEQFRGML